MLSDFSNWSYNISSADNIFPTGDSLFNNEYGSAYFTKTPFDSYGNPIIPKEFFHNPKNLLSSMSIVFVCICHSSFFTVCFMVWLLSTFQLPSFVPSISSPVSSSPKGVLLPSCVYGYSIVSLLLYVVSFFTTHTSAFVTAAVTEFISSILTVVSVCSSPISSCCISIISVSGSCGFVCSWSSGSGVSGLFPSWFPGLSGVVCPPIRVSVIVTCPLHWLMFSCTLIDAVYFVLDVCHTTLLVTLGVMFMFEVQPCPLK